MANRLEDAVVALRQIIRATELDTRLIAKQSGLTPSQLLILQVIAKTGSAAPSALAKAASLSQATVTALLDRLETRGLLKRTRDVADRRRVHVNLTPDGMAVVKEAPGLRQERFERRFLQLEDWETAFLVAAREKAASMNDAEDLEPTPPRAPGDFTVSKGLAIEPDPAPATPADAAAALDALTGDPDEPVGAA